MVIHFLIKKAHRYKNILIYFLLDEWGIFPDFSTKFKYFFHLLISEYYFSIVLVIKHNSLRKIHQNCLQILIHSIYLFQAQKCLFQTQFLLICWKSDNESNHYKLEHIRDFIDTQEHWVKYQSCNHGNYKTNWGIQPSTISNKSTDHEKTKPCGIINECVDICFLGVHLIEIHDIVKYK